MEIKCKEIPLEPKIIEKPKERKKLTVPKYKLPEVKKEIRKEVPKLTIPQVLRRFGDPYDALINELYSEGCKACAHCMKLCAMQEEVLLADQSIRYPVKDDREFLYLITDKSKLAEKFVVMKNDRNKCMDILLQVPEIIEEKGQEYSWLLSTFFSILKKIVLNWEGKEYNHSKCKVLFRYGKLLSGSGKKFSKEAIENLTDALELARGINWNMCMDTNTTMYQEISSLLATVLLREADDNADMHPEIAAELASKAVLVLLDNDVPTNKLLYVEANLKKIRYLIYSKACEEAQSCIKNVSPNIMMSPKLEHKCEYYLLYGIANFCMKNNTSALRKIRKSLKISEDHELKKLQAEGNLYLGKILSEDPETIKESENCFLLGKQIYVELNDFENIRKANYLIGNHQALSIFGSFIRHLNNADIDFCHKFRLQQWKSQGVPFWTSEEFDIDYEKERHNRNRDRGSLLDRDCLLKSVF